MGVDVRGRKPRERWISINHRGCRTAKKVGSREAAEATASAIEEKPGTEAFHLRSKSETVTLRHYRQTPEPVGEFGADERS